MSDSCNSKPPFGFTAMSAQGLTLFKLLSLLDLARPSSFIAGQRHPSPLLPCHLSFHLSPSIACLPPDLPLKQIWLNNMPFLRVLFLCFCLFLCSTQLVGCPALPSVRPRSAPSLLNCPPPLLLLHIISCLALFPALTRPP